MSRVDESTDPIPETNDLDQILLLRLPRRPIPSVGAPATQHR